jgi:transketolase
MTALVAQRDAFGDTMVELCKRDECVVVLDGDLANSTKADKVALECPRQFLMMGIAEQNMLGVAAGLATVGLRPWVSSFAAFLATRALDQLRVAVAQPRLRVKLAAHYSGILTGYTGKTHQVVNDIAIMRTLPNMAVVAPCDATEARNVIFTLNEYDGPAYLRLTRDPAPVVSRADHPFRLGDVAQLRSGDDVALFSTGGQSVRALAAAGMLSERGISCAVLHVPTIKPLDVEAVLGAASRARAVVVCEEHSVLGGLGGAIAEVLTEHRPTRVLRLGLRDIDAESAPNDALLHKYGLSAEQVAQAVLRFLQST